VKVLASKGGCLPSAGQLLFLKCCLGSPEESMQAWQAWRQHHALDEIDEALYRLLPLLYRALRNAGYDGPEMPLLKGIYRRNWYCQQQLFHTLEPLLKRFNEAGVPTILLKGAALSRIFYPDPYTRYMSDTDILVPVEHIDNAVGVMQAAGWSTSVSLPLSRNFRQYSNACLFTNDKKEEVDLHWHLFSECAHYEDDTPFWQRAMPLQLNTQATSTFSATDHMLHTCIHGYRWNPLHPLRWIADAHMIAHHSGQSVDWNLMIEQAWEMRLTLRLRKALELLHNEKIIPLPDSVFKVLHAIPIMDFEQHEYDIVANLDPALSDPKRAFLWPLKEVWYRQRRRYVKRPQILCILTYPVMMAQFMHLAGLRQLPLSLIKIFFRKLYYRFINTKG
jgi:hypothetical protein